MSHRAFSLPCAILAVAACSGESASTSNGGISPVAPSPVVEGGGAPTASEGGVADSSAPPRSEGGSTAPAVPDAGICAIDSAAPAGGQCEPAPPPDAGVGEASPDGSDPSSDDFVCSWVLGIHTTYEWFAAGFETVVDNARWQCSGIEMAQFGWADPKSPLWGSPIDSPCTSDSKTPDRIVFSGVDTTSTTVAQFLPEYVSVVNIIKTKFPSVKRIDLMTTARAPGDMECLGANRPESSYIKPAQDDAIAMTAAMFPGFVFATPKWEVQSCSDFTLCPHLTTQANMVLAKTIGEYFLTH
jgi:hypothetical protein